MQNPFLKNTIHELVTDIGRRPERPVKIFAPLVTDSFGDFVTSVACCARIAAQFDHSLVTFYTKDTRHFKRPLLSLYPFALRYLFVEQNYTLGIESLISKQADSKSDAYHDLILPPQQIGGPFVWDVGPAGLKIPDTYIPDLEKLLASQGVDPGKWFCVFHYREPNYQYKKFETLRDSDPQKYIKMVDFIIDELGGQVVRLGHPEMSELPAREGYIDLARCPEKATTTMLHAFAVSRARFGISATSGPGALMGAFNLPMAYTDVIDWWVGKTGVNEWVLTQTVECPDGSLLRQEKLRDSGLMEERILYRAIHSGYTVHPAKAEELVSVARFLFEQTPGVDVWRDYTPLLPETRSNQFSVPRKVEANLRFLADDIF